VGREYAGKGQTTPDKLLALAELAAQVAPQVPLVFAHLGGGLPFYELIPEVRGVTTNVYYDTGAAGYLYAPEALAHVAEIVPGRLLFGSDYPVIGVQRMLDYARAGLPVSEHEEVLGGAAARLLGLRP
jgi:predicted TIM-barrel fold metal-dependent hydrolase